MADEPEAENGEAPAPAPKKSKKLIIIIAVAAVLLIGGGAAAFMLLGKHDKEQAADGTTAEATEAPEGDEKVDASKLTYYALPDMIVNLQGERNRPNFLKVSMSLELAKPEDQPLVEKALPRIVDNFQVYMRELRVDEVRGSAGLFRLREELLARVNQAVAPVKVRDVLFKEILVQ